MRRWIEFISSSEYFSIKKYNDILKTFLSTDCTNYNGVGDVEFSIYRACTENQHGEVSVVGYVGKEEKDVEIILPETVEMQGYLYDVTNISWEALHGKFITAVNTSKTMQIIL